MMWIEMDLLIHPDYFDSSSMRLSDHLDGLGFDPRWCRTRFSSFSKRTYDGSIYRYYLSVILELMECRTIIFEHTKIRCQIFRNYEDITDEIEDWIEDNNIDLNTDEGKFRFKLVWA